MSGWRSHLDAPYGEGDTEPMSIGSDSFTPGDDVASPFEAWPSNSPSASDASAYHEHYASDVPSASGSRRGGAADSGADYAPEHGVSPFPPARSSSRAAVWGSAIVVLIVAFVASAFIIPRVKVPRELIASYVWAVSNGDFERATELANPGVPQSSRALLASGVLDADHRITSYNINFDSESFTPFGYSVRVSYVLGSEEGKQYEDSTTLSLHLKPNGSWAFDKSLLNVMQLPRSETFTINGVSVSDAGFDPKSICSTSDTSCKLMRPMSDDDFCVPAYPGIYSVNTPLPADDPESFTIVQQDATAPFVPFSKQTSNGNGGGSDDNADDPDGPDDADGSAGAGTDDAANSAGSSGEDSEEYGYAETRSADGTWIAVVEADRPYTFFIDIDWIDEAKVSILRQLDAHTRSCVNKVNARDLSDDTCTFLSEYLDLQNGSTWNVSYTPGELKGDLLSPYRCKPQDDGTVVCAISDNVSSELVLNVTYSGGDTYDSPRSFWHSWDDTIVITDGSVTPVFAAS